MREVEGCSSQERWAGAVQLPKRLLIHSSQLFLSTIPRGEVRVLISHRKLRLGEVRWLLAVPSMDKSRESEGIVQKNQD